jgi:hypothetical protein
MKEFRDNNFNEKQIKGLDMVMRALAKQYKFVKGWQLDTRYEEYMYTLYIDLFIDINDLAEQTNNYINKNRVGEKKGSSIFFALTPNKNGEPLEGFTPEWDQFVNDSYEYGKEIRDKMNFLYIKLPYEFKIHVDTGEGENNSVVRINVDEYIIK